MNNDNVEAGPLGAGVAVPRPTVWNRINWNIRSPEIGSSREALKNHLVAATGEFVGTFLFLFFALGIATTVNTISIPGQNGVTNLLVIALAFGFSLATTAWVFFRISGGLFNPAVSLGLMLVGAITPLRAVILTTSQILGGIAAPALISVLLPGPLRVQTKILPGMNIAQALFLEMFLTSLLMITILMLACEKHRATFLAPVGIGLSLFIAHLLGIHWTGASLNPARSIGPAVVDRQFDGNFWVYIVGPFLGAIIAAGFYKFIKFMQYEMVNSDQDRDSAAPAVVKEKKIAAAALAAGLVPPSPSAMAKIGSSMSRRTGRSVFGEPAHDVQGSGMRDMLTAEVADDVVLGGGIGVADSLRLKSLKAKLDLILFALQGRPAAVPQIVVEDESRVGEESTLGSHRVLIEEPAPFR